MVVYIRVSCTQVKLFEIHFKVWFELCINPPQNQRSHACLPISFEKYFLKHSHNRLDNIFFWMKGSTIFFNTHLNASIIKKKTIIKKKSKCLTTSRGWSRKLAYYDMPLTRIRFLLIEGLVHS